MTPEEKIVIGVWKMTTLAGLTENLASYRQAFIGKPIALFNTLTGQIGNQARAAFMDICGFRSHEEFSATSPELKTAYMTELVAALNAAFPVDYPYIVALIYSDETPQMKLCSMERKGIPGWQDMVSPNVIPILRIKNTPLGDTGGIKVSIDEVEFLHPGKAE